MSFSTLLRFSQYQLIARVPWMLLCKHNNRQRFWSTFKTKCCISSSLREREIEKRERDRQKFFFLFCCKIPKKKAGKRTKKLWNFALRKENTKSTIKKKISYSLIYIEYHILVSYTQTLICMLQKKTLFLPSNRNVSPWFWIDNE